ncbi:alpha/beta-hydrolase [Clavulina sp. PMI_390]|nr:alpha/beta-hydrolase [Clavulina sp. PMI_390]
MARRSLRWLGQTRLVLALLLAISIYISWGQTNDYDKLRETAYTRTSKSPLRREDQRGAPFIHENEVVFGDGNDVKEALNNHGGARPYPVYELPSTPYQNPPIPSAVSTAHSIDLDSKPSTDFDHDPHAVEILRVPSSHWASSWLSFIYSWLFARPPHEPKLNLKLCEAEGTGPIIILPDRTARIQGIECRWSGVKAWLGVRYAMPPTGRRRFAKPVKLPVVVGAGDDRSNTGADKSDRFGKMCLQSPSPTRPKWAMSEDCLNLNVFVPPNPSSVLTKPGERLPVMVWFYGGGLMKGSSVSFNATQFVLNSANKGKPVIVVTFNYRLSSFGFLASSDIESLAQEEARQSDNSAETAINAGFYDMKSVLEWVQRNIGAFGGDRHKVTVFGQSAGAISIGSFLLADGGKAVKDLNLFRGAIMQSGAPMADGNRFPNATDGLYALLLRTLDCPTPPSYASITSVLPYWYLQTPSKFSLSSSRSTAAERLDCLRKVPPERLLEATANVMRNNLEEVHWMRPFDRAQDGWFHNGTAAENVRDGKIAVIPILIGTMLDEGTMFAPKNIQSPTGILDYFHGFVARSDYNAFASTMEEALSLYPDDPSQGSPFEPELYGVAPTHRFYGDDNQYKRIAAMIGDSMFEGGRRAFLSTLSKKDPLNPAFVYQLAIRAPNVPPNLGMSHSSDLAYVQGEYLDASSTDPIHAAVSEKLMDYWINFAWYLNPNGDSSIDSVQGKDLWPWPRYGSDKLVLRVEADTARVITDDWRKEGIEFMASPEWTRLQMM